MTAAERIRRALDEREVTYRHREHAGRHTFTVTGGPRVRYLCYDDAMPYVEVSAICDGPELAIAMAFGEDEWELEGGRIAAVRYGDTRYVRDPGTCTIEPANAYEEDYGIYTCSGCGEKWQFSAEGPRGNGWTCCPRCRRRIEDKEEQ